MVKEFLHALVTTALGFSTNVSARMVAKKFRMSRKCLYQSLQRRFQIKDGALDFWANIKKHQRSIVLSTETRTLKVVDYGNNCVS